MVEMIFLLMSGAAARKVCRGRAAVMAVLGHTSRLSVAMDSNIKYR